MIAVLAIMAMMAIPVLASDSIAPTTPAESIGLSTATGNADGTAWNYKNDDDGVIESLDTTEADIDVWALTTQTDAYEVTIEWGDMTYNYAFGLWDPTAHAWAGLGWTTADFDGINDKVTVTNHSSQPINANFSYAGAASFSGTHTTGTFTTVSGNANGTKTDTMALLAVGYGVVYADAPFKNTYLNLQGIPDSIGTTAKKIGTISVTISV